MRYQLARGLHATGLARLSRALLTRRGRFVLTLHNVFGADRGEIAATGQRGLPVPEAEAMLAWLAARTTPLTAQAFLETDQPGILITVDDGKANHVEDLLPLLERYRVPAVFFVTTRHVRDPRGWLPSERAAAEWTFGAVDAVPEATARKAYDGMGETGVRRLAGHPLITIGAHSAQHPRLPECDDPTLMQELTGPKTYLEELTGRTIDLFAYPYGVYDGRVLDAVRQAGYTHAFAEEALPLGEPRQEIARLHVEHGQPYYLAAKLSGLYRAPLRGRP